jgi:hypothetical protein
MSSGSLGIAGNFSFFFAFASPALASAAAAAPDHLPVVGPPMIGRGCLIQDSLLGPLHLVGVPLLHLRLQPLKGLLVPGALQQKVALLLDILSRLLDRAGMACNVVGEFLYVGVMDQHLGYVHAVFHHLAARRLLAGLAVFTKAVQAILLLPQVLSGQPKRQLALVLNLLPKTDHRFQSELERAHVPP